MRDEIGGRGVVHGYGMTEVPMISNGSPHDTDEQLANTDGKPVEGAEVRIVTLDGPAGGPDEEGEVRVQGPDGVPRLHRPRAQRRRRSTRTGYFRTGDLGRLRADGHLALTGRLKDVIVRKGENISAKEIEDLLYTHPKVIEVAVIGLPDPERGERVCAVVQLAEDADGLELAEVVAFCRDAGLMTQKIPEQLEIRTEWPRAGTGKIVKKSLRDEYAADVSRTAANPAGRRRGAAGAAREPPLPHRLRLHREHLPLADGRGHHPVARRVHRARRRHHPGRPPRRPQRRHRALARGRADARAGLGGAGPGRLPPARARGPPVRVRPELGQIDLVVALDRRHQQTLRSLGADPDRLVLLRAFDAAAGAAADVPDPYYGDHAVFDECRDMIAAACSGLVASLATHWDRLWAA